MRILLVLFILLLLMVSQVSSQNKELFIKEVQPVAQTSLQRFSQLVTKENYKQMGFEAPEEVLSANLGFPIQDFMVRLDKLVKYESGSKPDELLTETNQFVYPVLVKGKVKSSITISKTMESWQAVSFGGPNYVKLVSNTLMDSSKATGLEQSSYFIVRIPSLNLFFIGFHSNNELMFIPLRDDTRLKFKAGASLQAKEVFSTILPDAKAHDGLPK